MSLIDTPPRATIPVTIDDRKLGKLGHRRLGELHAITKISELMEECFVKTADISQKEVLDVLLETLCDYRLKVEDELIRIARRVDAVKIFDAMNPEDLPN